MSGLASVPARTIVTEAATELGVIASGETLSTADADVILGKLARLFDNWNAIREAVWASAFLTETLTPNLNPHTIGPTGATWTVDQRPIEIVGANLIFTGTNPNINTTITVRDAAWYLGLTVPTLATTWPTDLYYQPDWPNGKCFFYPVPTTAYGVQLLVRVVIGSALTLDSAIWMPPGYRDAATLTLAEMSAALFGMVIPPSLVEQARTIRAQIFGNNDVTPRLATQDSGIPTSRGTTRSNWNYLSGMLTK